MTISIITPCFNRASHISICINSLLDQSYMNWELILVDDGSTDQTKDVVDTYKDDRIKYFYKENEERSIARNYGLTKASGDYILFLDSDDYLPSNALQNIIESIELNQVSVPSIISVSNRFFEDRKEVDFKTTLKKDYTPKSVLENFQIINVNQCAHRSCFVGNNFDSRFTLWEDTHLWLRLLAQFPVVESKAEVHCLIHKDSGVQIGFNKIEISYVKRYLNAVSSLLEYNLSISEGELKSLINEYAFNKCQMFFYVARLNKQWDVAYTILKESMKYKFDFIYILKSYIHVLLKS